MHDLSQLFLPPHANWRMKLTERDEANDLPRADSAGRDAPSPSQFMARREQPLFVSEFFAVFDYRESHAWIGFRNDNTFTRLGLFVCGRCIVS
jgi:hypothetical protein